MGSVPLKNAEAVLTAIAQALGDRVRRIPDGETGPRLNWIECQTRVFDEHPAFQPAPNEPGKDADWDWRNKSADAKWKLKPWYMLRPGRSARDVEFGPLGYAEAARASYEVFSRLKQEGIIPLPCRFQVSLPTPYNVIDQRILPAQRLEVEAPYERRMLAEVDEIANAIPCSELAIQWDTAHEVQNLDGGRPHWFDNAEQGILDRLVRLGDRVPQEVELGYHLCYGDFMHKHFIEPKDMGLMVRLANKLSGRVRRQIDWIHMPVPRSRTDEAYFAPLHDLKRKPGTQLYLGLIHYADGVEGTLRRLEVAGRFADGFGVATECGFGRRSPAAIPSLLEIHRAVADLAPAEAGSAN
ncbi:MAG: hypothetical protein WD871_00090 [Xanthobacteraceae bacterium]